ncbi:EF-hand domain-containing protein [Actinomadura rubrisoli]|nr:EF-hand domain-containing protein [Actinomadura rubrisoli]
MTTASSDLRFQKFNRWFKTADVDDDGLVDRRDFEQYGKAYAKALGIPPDSDKYQRMVEVSKGVWDLQAPHDHDGTVRMNIEQWIEAAVAGMQSRRDDYLARASAVADAYFEAADADGTGRLSRDEHSRMLQVTMAVSGDDARAVFDRMDLDGDGAISRDEFRQGFIDFLSSDDPDAPGNWFFGPL